MMTNHLTGLLLTKLKFFVFFLRQTHFLLFIIPCSFSLRKRCKAESRAAAVSIPYIFLEQVRYPS